MLANIHAGTVLLSVLVVAFAIVWLIVVLMNALRLMKVLRLDEEDKADNRGWIVWGLSVGSLFAGCCLALVAFAVVEWGLKPLDPYEDSLGTILLYGVARTNLAFVIISNVVLALTAGLVYSHM